MNHTATEVIDALLKIHKNKWMDALRYVVEKCLAAEANINANSKKLRSLEAENAELKNRLAQCEPERRSWMDDVLEKAHSEPETESVFPQVR